MGTGERPMLSASPGVTAALVPGCVVGLVEELREGAGEAVADVFGEGLRLKRRGLSGVLGSFLASSRAARASRPRRPSISSNRRFDGTGAAVMLSAPR